MRKKLMKCFFNLLLPGFLCKLFGLDLFYEFRGKSPSFCQSTKREMAFRYRESFFRN